MNAHLPPPHPFGGSYRWLVYLLVCLFSDTAGPVQ